MPHNPNFPNDVSIDIGPPTISTAGPAELSAACTCTPGENPNFPSTGSVEIGPVSGPGPVVGPDVPGAQTGPLPVDLRTAGCYGILAGSTATNTGPTLINGYLGLYPGTSVTGYPPGVVNGQVNITNPAAKQAKDDLTLAYLDLEGRTEDVIIVAGNIGGQTLAPGLYKSTSSLDISSGDLTLDAGGNMDAIFIFQVASALTVTSGRQVILAGGAQSKNVFWQVGSSATLGTTSVFHGTIISLASITLATGATLFGRALARNAAMTADSNVITVPEPCSGTV